MKRLLWAVACLVLGWGFIASAMAASQGGYELPEPYLAWEKSYLRAFPQLQAVMDAMVKTTVAQIKEPEQDVLHNRVCSALVYKMAVDLKLPGDMQRLALIADLLHNIHKEEKTAVLTSEQVMAQSTQAVSRLRAAGYFKASPRFWGDDAVLKNAKIGANRSLVHHITGALEAERIMNEIGGFQRREIDLVQAAIIAHSTGYWYFRAQVDQLAGRAEAWRAIYPEPESIVDQLAHDADLISQFVPESVVPDGSKWRLLAKNRWGAKGAREEAHVVYYVFQRLFEEAKTDVGRQLAREQWDVIRPQLAGIMGLGANDDPIKAMGVPKAFQ